MPLETEISQDDLRVMANAIEKTEYGYRTSYMPVCQVSAHPRISEDGYIAIILSISDWHSPVNIIHKEDEKKVDGLCHRAVMEYLTEHIIVFEGRLYAKDCHPKRNKKGEVYICPETTLPEDEENETPAKA